MPCVTTWLDHEGIMPSRISEERKYCMISPTYRILKQIKHTRGYREQISGYQVEKGLGEDK